MKNAKRDRTIQHIVECIALYDRNAPEAEIRSAVDALDPESIGLLHGISGVLRHAVAAKMPHKWLRQIHGDMMDAFECLARINQESN